MSVKQKLIKLNPQDFYVGPSNLKIKINPSSSSSFLIKKMFYSLVTSTLHKNFWLDAIFSQFYFFYELQQRNGFFLCHSISLFHAKKLKKIVVPTNCDFGPICHVQKISFFPNFFLFTIN